MLVSLLDTNLCIRALRDRPPAIRERLKREQDTLCLSTVVLYELYVGAAQSSAPSANRAVIDAFVEPLVVLEFDAEAAFHTAAIRVDLMRKGQIIGPYDLMIAGHARSLGLKVITGNLGEFGRVDGLLCEDWI
ncbi:type II toxin-antitoxin system VapC family toxin [Novosphingobium sp.]|uniref:type II toxin-antitoxin system VapC family toxin n=1 Tax=Novosphingobium sp. TaxID=1874826 RepID=UPI002635AB9A|nr:type II toxin-antitoxin system VapC family toxin [Novosphingobium sp.]